MLEKNHFMVKVGFFQGEKNGIGVGRRTPAEVDKNWIFIDLKVE